MEKCLLVLVSLKIGEFDADEHLKWLLLVYLAVDILFRQGAEIRRQAHVEAKSQCLDETRLSRIVLANYHCRRVRDRDVNLA